MMRLPNDIRCHIEIIDPKWLGFCGTLYPVKQIARPFGAMSRCVSPRTKLFCRHFWGSKTPHDENDTSEQSTGELDTSWLLLTTPPVTAESHP